MLPRKILKFTASKIAKIRMRSNVSISIKVCKIVALNLILFYTKSVPILVHLEIIDRTKAQPAPSLCSLCKVSC